MSVSQETLDLIRAAIKKGSDVGDSLVRSKLTNRLVYDGVENDASDPFGEYLALMASSRGITQPKKAEPLEHVHDDEERVVLGENQVRGGSLLERSDRKKGGKEDKENWRNHWENLKKDSFCSLCKNNKEGREVYLSHDLKGPNGEITCPILLECVCRYCGKQGHTIAYCPENQSGTSVLKMINRHNRI